MKVRCITDYDKTLTLGKEYNVVKRYITTLSVINDDNKEFPYPIDYFEEVDNLKNILTITKIDRSYNDIASEIAEIVEKKQHDYGNSFQKTIDEYGNVAFYLRIEDKLNRLKSLDKKSAEVAESKIDTLRDIIGYTLLMLKMEEEREG